uniref:SH3 domain-binding protein 4 n=1 Tax=Anthurium amnicola TaxID=1678845 RepID=A0A1D1ZEH6_9ARAE
MSISTTELNACLVENWDTETLVLYLQAQGLKLDDEDFAIIRKEKINGPSFLDLTEEKFRNIGFALGPATLLAKEAKILKTRPKRSFSSYHTQADIKEVFAKYKLGDSISSIPQFEPAIHKLEDTNEALMQCVKELRLRLKNLGGLAPDSNEAVRCEFISSILHASVSLLEGLILAPQFEVVGDETTGRVDYAIKKLLDSLREEIVCITEGKQHQVAMGFCQNLLQIESACQTNKRKRKAEEAFSDEYDYMYGIVTTATEWYFILYTTEGIYSTSEKDYLISFRKSALDNEDEFRRSVKRVMEVIVGLLEDRAGAVDEKPLAKKRRVDSILNK